MRFDQLLIPSVYRSPALGGRLFFILMEGAVPGTGTGSQKGPWCLSSLPLSIIKQKFYFVQLNIYPQNLLSLLIDKVNFRF